MSTARSGILPTPWFRPLLAVVLGTLVLAIGFVGLLYVTLAPLQPPPKIPFNAERWHQAGVSSLDTTRHQMHEDLLRRHPLVGTSRDEVVALLGPPTHTNYFREWEMVYHMGPEPGFGVDSIWLVLRVADERVVEYKVLTD